MEDYKNEILKSIERKLVDTFDIEEINYISDIIMKVLYDYNISKKENIENKSNSNEELLNLYCSCLTIEGKSEKTIQQYKRACQ